MCPYERIVNQKPKKTKYEDLKIEVERLWPKQAVGVPEVIGALGAIIKKSWTVFRKSEH